MGLAEFIALDPYDPASTERKLKELIPRARGVVDYVIHPDGDVVVKYDPRQFSSDVLEDALGRLGFQLRHITDEPDADEAELRQALGQ
jgi:hypothetical protein